MIKWPWKRTSRANVKVSPAIGTRNAEASRDNASALLLLIVDLVLANGEFTDDDIDEAKRIADTFNGSIDPGVIDVTGLIPRKRETMTVVNPDGKTLQDMARTVVEDDEYAAAAVENFRSAVASIAVTKADKLKLAKGHLEKARDALAEAQSPAKLGRVRALIKAINDAIRYEHNRPYRKDEQ